MSGRLPHASRIERTMYLRTLIVIASVLGCAAVVACGGSGRPVSIANTGGVGGSPDPGGDGGGSTWTFATLDDDENTGYQPELRRRPDGALAAVWYRKTERFGSCQLPLKEPKPTDIWEIVYAEEVNGVFTSEVVTEVDLVSTPTGVSLAFDDGGAPLVAYTGGPHSEFRCGATNAMISRRSGGGWSHEIIDEDGAVPEMIFPEDVAYCADYQDACNQGGVVGHWPALGFVDGAPILAYRDIHFGFGVDAEEKSDVQLYWQGRLVTAEVTAGGGEFSRLAVGDGGALHLAHFNRHHAESEVTGVFTDGIWVIHYEDGEWSREKVVSIGSIGERIGFASFADELGLALFDAKKGQLVYVARESGSWSKTQVVDARGRTGLSPSLAYDELGRAAIAYQRCGPAGQQGADCLAVDDSLHFTIQTATGWKSTTVRSDARMQEGLYTSLAFDGDERPAIAFQESFYDSIDQVVRRRLVLARGERP